MSLCHAAGVYQIKNLVNGKVYIGSANKIGMRWKSHRSMLKNNRHHSKHLQSSWNTYGPGCFEFSVIEICPVEAIRERESELIKKAGSHLPGKGYNTIADPMYPELPQESIERMRKSKLGKKLSEEHKEKIRIGNLGKVVSEESREKIRQAFLGKKRNPEVAKKATESRLSKLKNSPRFTEDQIRFILTEYKKGTCRREISVKANIPYSVIWSLKNGWIKHCAETVTKIRQELNI